MTLKRAMQGRLNIMASAMALQQELMSIPEFGSEDETPFAEERKLVNNFKKTILLTAGAAEINDEVGKRAGSADEYSRYGN
jgi:hypothetical protein